MKSNLLLDITELVLTHLSCESSVTFVNIDTIYKEVRQGKTLSRRTNITIDEIKSSLREIFPIYKNNRRHTQDFKISSKTAYSTCKKLNLRLRPLSHICKRQ